MNQYWKFSSTSLGIIFCFFKPLFSYWKFTQYPATAFIWSTCLLTECLYLFSCFFFSKYLFSYSFFLGFFGASVLLQFSSVVFRSLCTHIVFFQGFFFRASVLISFLIGLFWSICSNFLKSISFLAGFFYSEHVLPCLYRLRWFYRSTFSHTGAVFFSETMFTGYKFVSCLLVFVEARAPILEAWSTCFFTGRLYRLRWDVFRSTCSHIVFTGGFRSVFSHT